jgi:hypothetical protein
MMTEARTFEALLRNEFRVFVHKVFATLSPGQTVPAWHVAAIAWRLERVRRGEIRRLIMSPHSSRSFSPRAPYIRRTGWQTRAVLRFACGCHRGKCVNRSIDSFSSSMTQATIVET